MCGILVVPNTDIKKDLYDQFNKIKMRGPDMDLVMDRNKYKFMFHRLAIMDLHEAGMQPFTHLDNLVVANGEIYNYLDLKKEVMHDFKSKSDCEIILPLFLKYDLDIFKMLDAEFVCVIYDDKRKSLIAARDPIGIRPLFYGHHSINHEICFASEAKALIELVDEVYPFPPGHYYLDGQFVKYTDLYDLKSNDSFDEAVVKIHDYLVESIDKRLHADAPLGFLLSGGLDSSLVCAVAADILKKPIKTFSIGMDKDAIDLKYAKDVADFIKSDHTEVIMSKSDVLGALKQVIYHLESYDITTVRASIGMYLVCQYIHEHTDLKVLLTGEVSDELFGYKYTDFAPSAKDFQEDSEKRIQELYVYDVLRADRTLAAHALEARVPFADTKFASYVLSINPELKLNTYGMGKYLLRYAFKNDGILPEHILWREKAAFSDGVGHSMVDDLKILADETYSDEVYETLKSKYKHNQPISKESLLYREIFESFYPDKGHLIPAFWMPNNTWKGLEDVKDPSARVLSNYGKSGE